MLNARDFRIIAALLISFGLHAFILMGVNSGKRTPVVAGIIRKKVTVKLVGRQIRSQRQQTARKDSATEPSQPLALPAIAPVDRVVQEIPPVAMPAMPEVPELKTGASLADGSPGSSTEVMARPLYRQNRPPEYPELARRRHWQGTAILEVSVGADGRVKSLSVDNSSGFRVLDEAAVDAVRFWLFEPGRKNSREVAMKILVPVRFQLK